MVDTKTQLLEQLKTKPKSKVLLKAVKNCDESIKELVQQTRTKNAKTYHKLIHADKKQTNEIDYFKKKLSNKEQLTVMKHLKEINSHTNIENLSASFFEIKKFLISAKEASFLKPARMLFIVACELRCKQRQ